MTNQTQTEEYGRLYWFVRNTLKHLNKFAVRHRVACSIIVLILVFALFHFRAWYQPLVIGVRKNAYAGIVLFPLVWLFCLQLKKGSIKRRSVWVSVGLLVLVGFIYWGPSVHQYLALHYRYRLLSVISLDQLPVSEHERIQPRNSVYSLAHEVMTESETPIMPDFVRVGSEYRWTLAIEPAYPIPRMLGSVKELFNVSGTAPSPDFSKENRLPVSFEVGEDLLWSRNTQIATIRTFGLWRYFNYEPADVVYFTDDNGEWVQIVSLIRWKGIFFPRPEFGGVQLIRQKTPTIFSAVRLALFGAGEWIKPKEVAQHPFLVGQNIVSFTVSRNIAHSFRFQNGFLAPFPGYHRGDIRIPDMAEDENDQPFTTYFRFPGEEQGMLYHYFALEPYDPEKLGLNTSLFVPADGTEKVSVYNHHQRRGSLIGVSAISAKVMESKKNYDWSRNRPVEHRPFIKQIDGDTRFFWLTTVVTLKEEDSSKVFIAGTVPDVVFTDAAYKTPIWVNPLAPNTWIDQIKGDMAEVWKDGVPPSSPEPSLPAGPVEK